MNIFFFKDPVPHVVIDGFFNQEDLKTIKDEVRYLYEKSYDSLCSDIKGNQVKSYIDKRKEIWITSQPIKSKIIEIWMNKINEPSFFRKMEEAPDTILTYVNDFNALKAIIAFYGDGDYIKEHTDLSFLTANLIFSYNPKNITGGEFVISNKTISQRTGIELIEKTIPFSNGQMIIFPSKHVHYVNKVFLKDNDDFLGKRISVQFFCHRTSNL